MDNEKFEKAVSIILPTIMIVLMIISFISSILEL